VPAIQLAESEGNELSVGPLPGAHRLQEKYLHTTAAHTFEETQMFSTRWRLFRLFGIPISVSPSWLVILALLTWTFAELFKHPARALGDIYPEAFMNLTTAGYVVLGLLTALAFFVCILLHEVGHAVVARRYGMPIRGINLFIFGGVAELEGEPPSAGSEFLMAIAGPLVSLMLAIVFGVVAWAGVQGHWPPEIVIPAALLAFINFTVLVFNLIPGFPLDGGRVLRSILWAITGNLRRATLWASTCGQIVAWLLVIWGLIDIFQGDLIGGLWLGLIGMFLNSAAQSSYQQLVIKEALQGEPVRRFMNTEPIVVPPEIDLRTFVEDYIYRYHHKAFPVGSAGRLEGYVSTSMLAPIPRSEWAAHTVGEVMRRNLDRIVISPDTDALHALQQIQRTGQSRLLVVDGGHLVGIVSLKDLLRFLQLKLELEGEEGRETKPEMQSLDQPHHTPAHS
jgi:Zn-dependent protease/CBS domain-containing protein